MKTPELETFTFADIQTIFFRWRWLAAFTFIALMVPSVLVIFLMPPTYEATGTVWINRQSPNADYSVQSQANSGNTTFRNVDRNEEINTYVEMLQSRVIVEAMADRLNLTRESLRYIRDARRYVRAVLDGVIDGAQFVYNKLIYLLHLGTEPTPEEITFLNRVNLLDMAQDRLSVRPLTDSNIIAVAFQCSDPLLAQKAANTILDQFIEYYGNIKEARAKTFFSDVSDKLGQELAHAEAELAVVEQETSNYSIEQQRGLLLNNMSETLERLKVARVGQAEIQARKTILQSRIETEPERIAIRSEIKRNPVLEKLEGELIELKRRRTLLQRKQRINNSIPLQQVEAEIAALQPQLDKINQHDIDGNITFELNPLRQELRSQLFKAEVELAALAAEEQALVEKTQEYRSELEALSDTELRLRSLKRKVSRLEEAYTLNVRNREQAKITEELAQARLADVRIIDYAAYPMKSIRPRKLLYLGIALGGALILALAMPFLAYFNDKTIFDEHDVEKYLNVRFVASFPLQKLPG